MNRRERISIVRIVLIAQIVRATVYAIYCLRVGRFLSKMLLQNFSVIPPLEISMV